MKWDITFNTVISLWAESLFMKVLGMLVHTSDGKRHATDASDVCCMHIRAHIKQIMLSGTKLC